MTSPDTQLQHARARMVLRDTAARLGASISIAALRAIDDAFAISPTTSAALAEALDGTLQGHLVMDLRERADTLPHGPEDHLLVARAIRAGAVDPLETLDELLRHGVRSPGDAVPTIVDDAFAVAVANGRVADALDRVHANALDARAADEPGTRWVLARAIELAMDSMDPRAVEFATAALDDAPVNDAGARERDARVALVASWTAPGDQAHAWRSRAIEATATGWSSRARALELIASGERAASTALDRTAVRHAVGADDARLEASALIALVNGLALGGDMRGAIRLQQRAVRRARLANAWREYAISAANLVWMLVEQLQLRQARSVAQELVEATDTPGLARYRIEARLHAAGVEVVAGDAVAARRALGDVQMQVGDAADEAWDAVYRALRIAEVAAVAGRPSEAARALEAAHALVQRHGIDEQELDLALVACRVGDEQERLAAATRLPALLGTSDAMFDAQALTWLARGSVLGQDTATFDAALREALATADDARAPIVELAAREATATLSGDARALERLADEWAEHGYGADAALARASAGVSAGRAGDAARAGTLLDDAGDALAQLGALDDLARVRAARAAIVGGGARRRGAGRSPFDELPADVRGELEPFTLEQVVGRGRVLDAATVMVLHSGAALVERLDAGAWTPLDVLGAGSMAGLDDALDLRIGAPRRVVTLEPCEVTSIPASTLLAIAMRTPVLAVALARHAAAAERRIVERAPRAGEELDHRTARLLLELASAVGYDARQPGLLRTHIGREQLGALLGVTRVGITRSLARHVRAGRIATSGQRIRIVDRDALEAATTASPHM